MFTRWLASSSFASIIKTLEYKYLVSIWYSNCALMRGRDIQWVWTAMQQCFQPPSTICNHSCSHETKRDKKKHVIVECCMKYIMYSIDMVRWSFKLSIMSFKLYAFIDKPDYISIIIITLTFTSSTFIVPWFLES